MALIRGLNMHMKTIRSVMYSGLVGLTVVAAMSAQALQTVDPKLSLAGASINGSTQAVPAGSTFTVYGVYSDDSTNPESGLGLKVKYNGTHLTGVTISEEYTKCRIAVADVQNPTTATAQAVMGWIDTAIRPNGVVGSATGAVGWPDLADLASGGCLNPGTINTDTAAASATSLKLFKMTGTMAAGCTSAAACTSTVTFDSEGNYSYANAGAGFTNKSFTITGAAAPTQALAATPYVSRKTHGAAGTFDIVIDPAGSATAGQSVTVEPRQAQSGQHQIVIAFTSSVSSAQYPTVTAAAGATSLPVATAFNGNEMTVTIGSAGTPVPNGSRVTVSATGVGTAAGVNPSVVVGFLVGDVSNNRTVNSTDVGTVKGQSGVAVTSSNFKSDLSANGSINSTDVGLVKGASGTSIN